MDQHRTSVVWSPATRAHDPLHEVWVGVVTPGTDVPARVDAILSALTVAGHRLVAARPQPDGVLAWVHDASLIDFLAGAARRWRLGPYTELVGQSRVVPYFFPTPAMTAGLPTRPAVAIHAEAGSYAYDTAAIFYGRGDVLYGSVHVDPAAGWFPHIVGYADETGTGDGAGCTRNWPLPEGTADGAWLEAIGDLADWVVAAGCSALVVSLGVDAAVDDPESPLLITADGYRRAGSMLGAAGLPAVVVQEGGYHLPTLGDLVAAYLDGHARATATASGRGPSFDANHPSVDPTSIG
jgi:acetoin utilization deacetylase AcuC-like enzyme